MKIINVTLNNNNEVRFGDFNVFIGGNGIGKTSFLIEVYTKSTNTNKTKYFWINSVNFDSKDIPGDIKLLKNSLSRKVEGQNLTFHSTSAKNIDGNVDMSDNFTPDEHDKLDSIIDKSILKNYKYRKPFIALSSCEARLNLSDNSGLAALNNPPQDPINILYRDKKLLSKINDTVFKIFKRKLVLLSHTGTGLQIVISKDEPPVFDNNAENLQNEYHKIEQ